MLLKNAGYAMTASIELLGNVKNFIIQCKQNPTIKNCPQLDGPKYHTEGVAERIGALQRLIQKL
jgi:hypothetical protein